MKEWVFFLIVLLVTGAIIGAYVVMNPQTTTSSTTSSTTSTTQPPVVHCDANNPCKEGDCYLFQYMSFAYCYVGDPCEKCPTKTCRVAESYPMQVFCDKAGRAEAYSDKRGYSKNENVTLTIKNVGEADIWYVDWMGEPLTRSCRYTDAETRIQKDLKGTWVDQLIVEECCIQPICSLAPLRIKTIAPKESIRMTWDQSVWADDSPKIAQPGRYRIRFAYYLTDAMEDAAYADAEFSLSGGGGNVLFLDEHRHVDGKILGGESCGMMMIDFPTYRFDEVTRTLSGRLNFEVNDSLKVVYGSGMSLSGDAGGGAATRLTGVYGLPYEDGPLRIMDVREDGTVELVYRGENIKLAAGESWGSENVSVTEENGCKMRKNATDSIVNYGFVDKENILVDGF
jgi:hypothetical protein